MTRATGVLTPSFQAPPQLWKLEHIKEAARLQLRHTYMPHVTVDFAGPSYFGGKNDQLVLCAGKGMLAWACVEELR